MVGRLGRTVSWPAFLATSAKGIGRLQPPACICCENRVRPTGRHAWRWQRNPDEEFGVDSSESCQSYEAMISSDLHGRPMAPVRSQNSRGAPWMRGSAASTISRRTWAKSVIDA